MDFNERLAEMRKDKKLTQKELAVRLNLSNAVISHYEVGNSEPSLETLMMIAKTLGVSTDYLIGLTDDPEASVDLNEEFVKNVSFRKIMNNLKMLSSEKRRNLYQYIQFLVYLTKNERR